MRAALAIRSALARFGDRVRAERGIDLAARIGIHTGPVVVGTMGSDVKMDYTAIGDTTNLAARLQTLAEPGSILVSEATSTAGDANPERWAQLVHHLSRSDNRERALDALLGAARSAERVPSYPSAAHFYRQAWDLATADGPEAGVRTTRLALDAAVGLARMVITYDVPGIDDTPEILSRADTYAEALGERRRRAEVLSYLGLLLIRRPGRFAAGLELVEEARALARELGLVRYANRAATALGEAPALTSHEAASGA